MKAWREGLLITALAVLVGLVAHLDSVAAAEMQVTEEAGKFQPTAITIKAGDTVRFTFGSTPLCRLLIAGADGTQTTPSPQTLGQAALRKFSRPGLFHAKCGGSDEWSLTIMVRPQVAG